MVDKKTKKIDGKTCYFVPKNQQSTGQKANNGGNYFQKKFLTKEQREALGL